jgi:hypothetical protein
LEQETIGTFFKSLFTLSLQWKINITKKTSF